MSIWGKIFKGKKIPKSGDSDDWVYVWSDKDSTRYYNSSSVKIDKQNKVIKVWVKRVFTDKGKIDYLRNFEGIDKQKLIDIDHLLILHLLDYNEWKYDVTHITNYSKSDNVLHDGEGPSEWSEIIHDSVCDILLNKLLHGYNIKR